MSSFSSMQEDYERELQAQISSLKSELSSIKRQLAKRGAGAYAEGRHASEHVAESLRDTWDEALPYLRDQAHWLGDTARRKPVTAAAAAAVGLAAVGLAVSLFMRR